MTPVTLWPASGLSKFPGKSSMESQSAEASSHDPSCEKLLFSCSDGQTQQQHGATE